jgi:L-asparagine transporter-like permease
METPSPEPVKKKKFRWKFWLFTILFAPVVLFLAYTWFVLTWSYSTGERAGYVQKLSKKGFIAKTWEGELAMVSMPGTLPEIFAFTVREDSIAQKINRTLGKRVKLTYEQHIGIPTRLFGETEYFITNVEVVE